MNSCRSARGGLHVVVCTWWSARGGLHVARSGPCGHVTQSAEGLEFSISAYHL